ncbi:peroxide stress protein YaaA [Nocardiopsis sediminis]|uniref:Peroxide stress protein YaaA n=1 Tax=Nocardiopsis sediminis TaxID=1778267 RepID=A0ABV8FSJ0_9ACTN
MLILLPPSEGKASGGDGPPLDLGALSLPEVTSARQAVLDALDALCSGPDEAARTVLGLSPGQQDAVERDRALRDAPTLPAAGLYTGVLYDHLRLPALLDGATAAAAASSVLIFSGLWGVVGPTDPLPPYRLSMGVRLPPLGPLGAFWRGHLTDLLSKRADGELVVDCRSATYAAAFKPAGAVAERTVSVRVVRETTDGATVRRTVVSHMAKATRGAMAHTLLATGASPTTPAELAEALKDLGHPAELTPPTARNRPYTLTVVERS